MPISEGSGSILFKAASYVKMDPFRYIMDFYSSFYTGCRQLIFFLLYFADIHPILKELL